jgi:hypothetical protein
MGMDKGCKSIKHCKSKNSTPLRGIINKDSFFNAIMFNPFKKPVDFNRLNRNENNKGCSPYQSYGINTNDACD